MDLRSGLGQDSGPCRVAPWLLLCIGLLLLGLVSSAQARVVGLVFDDSGSMTGQFQKALFAAQIVVASLDESDRLFVVRLNGERGRIEEVPAARRASFLRDLRLNWMANGATPYQPLQGMLETLVDATSEIEDAALLVFTDGAFTDAPPAGLDRLYADLRGRFQGRSLQVFFVALPGDAPSVDVRSAVLTAFNGAPDAGAIDIRRASDIVPGLRDLVSILAGTDPGDTSHYLTQEGARLQFKLPFSIRRILVLTSGHEGVEPVQWRKATFALAKKPPTEYELGMRDKDSGEPHRLKARVVHLVPKTPVPAATEVAIELDRAFTAEDRIIIVSGLEIELLAKGQDGVPLPRDAQGRVRVQRGEPVLIEAWLVDAVNGKRQPVDFYGTGITPAFTLNDGLSSRPMRFDAQSQRAGGDAGPYQKPGQIGLSVVARVAGLSYVRSDDLVLSVEAAVAVAPSLTGTHLMDCAGCAADRVEILRGVAQGPAQDLYAIEALVGNAPRAGQYRLALDQALPAGLELVGADGAPVLDRKHRARLTLEPQLPVTLRLRYDHRYQADTPTRVRLSLEAVDEGLRGAAAMELELVPKLAVMRLVPDGHTLADPSAPFVLPVTEVGGGHGLYAVAEGLRLPLAAADLSVTSPTRLPLGFEVLDERRILIRPMKRLWCDCLTPSGQHQIRIHYDNPSSGQSATLDLPLEIGHVPFWPRCWQELALLLAVLLALLKTYCLLRTVAFPPHSQVRRCEIEGSSGPRYHHLHRPWRRLFSLKCSDERDQAVWGLDLVARETGVGISRKSSCAGIVRTQTAERLERVFETNPHRPEIVCRWGEELRDEAQGYRYFLVRDRYDQNVPRCD